MMGLPGMSLGSIWVNLGLNNAQFIAGMNGSVAALRRGVTAMYTTAARAVKMTGIAVMAFQAVSIKAFASFEEQMANVSTMLDDHTMHYMPAYTKAVKAMAIEFGEGTQTITKGLYDILSASIEPSKALDVLTASIKAAKAGMTTTAVAADAITTILNSYNMSADKATHISDILFATVKRGKITFEQLAGSIGMVTSLAATAGLRFEEVGAAIATMTRAGVPAQRAITALRSIISSFMKPSEEAAKLWKEKFGEAMNTAVLRTKGLTGVLMDQKKVTSEELAALFPNIRAITGLAAEIQNASKQMDDYRFMMASAGKTEEAFLKMTDNVAFAMRKLWQAIKITAVETGEKWRQTMMNFSDWIVTNQKMISVWSQKVASYIIFIGDIMKGTFLAITTDFGTTIHELGHIALTSLVPIFRTMVEMARLTGNAIWKALREGIFGEQWPDLREVNRRAEQLYKAAGGAIREEMQKQLGTFYRVEEIKVPVYLDQDLWKESYQRAFDLVKSEMDTSFLNPMEQRIKKIWGDYGKDFKRQNSNVFDIIDSAWDRLQDRLNGVMDSAKEAWFGWGKVAVAQTVKIYNLFRDIGNEISGRIQQSLGMFINSQKQVTPEMEKANQTMRDMLEALDFEIEAQGWVNKGWERGRDLVEFYHAALVATNNDIFEANVMLTKYKDKLKELGELQRQQERNDALQRWAEDAGNIVGNMKESIANSLNSLSDAMAEFLVKGKADWREWAASALQSILQVIIRYQMLQALKSIGLGGIFGAKGLVFQSGNVKRMQHGGIISSPAMIPLRDNRTAFVAERRPEAVMPLARNDRGELGVLSSGQAAPIVNIKNVTVYDREAILSEMNTRAGERIILNKLKKFGII